jgi:replicative DNA helicase
MLDNNQAITTARALPNDTEAEQAVLSSMFYDVEALNIAREILNISDFYRPDYGHVFENMCELSAQNKVVDLITLLDKLNEKGLTDKLGGKDFIISIADGFFTSANVRHYISIIREKSILRRLINAGNKIISKSFESSQSIDDIIDDAQKDIFSISENRHNEHFSHIKDLVAESVSKLEELYFSSSSITGISTGFMDFDSKTAGLQKSDLILIAARPSMGKTAFALNAAYNVASKHNNVVAIFSLEMSKLQLVNRLLASEAQIDSQKLRTGSIMDNDWIKIAEAMWPLANSNIYIDDTPNISVTEIKAKCRKLKAEKGLALIVIDYLQLMSAKQSKDSRQQEISDISRGLKSLARELDLPVIALSQLSRACELRADHRPILSDLRESGAIEQDADLVCFLYRDEYYHPDTDDKNVAELIVAKQRNGPTGTIKLVWRSIYLQFKDKEYDY